MRERIRDKGRLEDILEYSKNVEKLIDGFSYDDFTADIRTYFAVMKNIEIVGEAVYMLTKDFKDVHAEIPWQIIQGMRHVLVHGYYKIRPKQLWNTIEQDIPELKPFIEQYYKECEE